MVGWRLLYKRMGDDGGSKIASPFPPFVYAFFSSSLVVSAPLWSMMPRHRYFNPWHIAIFVRLACFRVITFVWKWCGVV